MPFPVFGSLGFLHALVDLYTAWRTVPGAFHLGSMIKLEILEKERWRKGCTKLVNIKMTLKVPSMFLTDTVV